MVDCELGEGVRENGGNFKIDSLKLFGKDIMVEGLEDDEKIWLDLIFDFGDLGAKIIEFRKGRIFKGDNLN